VSSTISIPFQSRDESLALTASHARHLATDDDRAVARQVVFAGMQRGLRSAGELLDELAEASPGERRAMLDDARRECGLEPIADVATRERAATASFTRTTGGMGLQACHADGCAAIPTTESGAWRHVNVRRWWCPEHVDRAQPGDMDPQPPFRYSPSGAIVPNDPADDARESAVEASRAAQLEAEDVTRAIEAAELEEHRRIRDEAARRELPPHLRGAA
jgi:hypothetical protein